MAQQREQAVADEVHRRLVAGDEQQDDRRQQLVGAQAVARFLGRDQRADEVGLGCPPAFLEQRHEVRGEGQHRAGGTTELLGRRVEVEDGRHVAGEAPEQLSVLGRNAEQLADHRDRKREGEVADHVEAPRFPQRRQQLLGHLGDARAELLDGARGERLADQSTQPGVVGSVHEQEDLRQHLTGDVGHRGGVALVAAPARLAQDRRAPRRATSAAQPSVIVMRCSSRRRSRRRGDRARSSAPRSRPRRRWRASPPSPATRRGSSTAPRRCGW